MRSGDGDFFQIHINQLINTIHTQHELHEYFHLGSHLLINVELNFVSIILKTVDHIINLRMAFGQFQI